MTASAPAAAERLLVGDIGGSTARFAFVEIAAGRPVLVGPRHFPVAGCSGIAEAIARYLEARGGVEAAALAIAGPVTDDAVTITNSDWRFSRENLQRALRLQRLLVLNDFTALALALPLLGDGEVAAIGGGRPEPRGAKALIGPGTGLGVSGLVHDGKRWLPLASEGGHATAAAMNDEEAAVLDWLRPRHGHVSWERVLSGPGLVNLHAALGTLSESRLEQLSSQEIVDRGRSGDCRLCRQALRMFCAMLGTAAGNLALTLGARGGVYIGGGIAPRIVDFLGASEFRARFEAKGRLASFLRQVPTFVVIAAEPGLLGAAVALTTAETEGI